MLVPHDANSCGGICETIEEVYNTTTWLHFVRTFGEPFFCSLACQSSKSFDLPVRRKDEHVRKRRSLVSNGSRPPRDKEGEKLMFQSYQIRTHTLTRSWCGNPEAKWRES
jgi:hypothetical protein